MIRLLVIGVMLGLVVGLVARCAGDDGLPPLPASTTPAYPLGHEPTTCAEYIATNTYHEGC